MQFTLVKTSYRTHSKIEKFIKCFLQLMSTFLAQLLAKRPLALLGPFTGNVDAMAKQECNLGKGLAFLKRFETFLGQDQPEKF